MPATPITRSLSFAKLSSNTPHLQYSKDAELNRYFKRATEQTIYFEEGEYLSDKAKTLTRLFVPNQFIMLKSDTGMGKTTFAIDHLLKNPAYTNTILVVPLTVIRDEFINKLKQDLNMEAELHYSTETSDLDLVNFSDNKRTVVIATYHNFEKYFNSLQIKPDLIIWDEIHWLVSYAFLENLTAGLIDIIQRSYGNTTMIGLTATPGPLEEFSDCFLIDKIVFANYPELRVPPKNIIIYKGNKHISKIDMIKHYIMANLEQFKNGEKLLAVVEKGIPTRHESLYDNNILDKTLPTGCFGNPMGFFSHLQPALDALNKKEGLNLKISMTKSENKMSNNTIQQIVEYGKFDDETDLLFTTIFISNGVNIIDERVKHVLVLSDKPDLIKQTAARLRIPKNASLVLFHRNYDIPQNILNNLPTADEYRQMLFEKTFTKYTFNVEKENFYTFYNGEQVFNMSKAINMWYAFFQQKVFNEIDTLLEIMYPGVERLIPNAEFMNTYTNNINQTRIKMGYGYEGGPTNKQIQQDYGITIVEKHEEKLYNGCGKTAFENGLKKMGKTLEEVEYETFYNENKNKMYKLIRIKPQK